MSDQAVSQRRLALIRERLGNPPARLWCALLTPYRQVNGRLEIDAEHLTAHLRTIAPYVGGLLVAGSTGDGWDMSNDQFRRLVELTADETIVPRRIPKLYGILGATTEIVLEKARIARSVVGEAEAMFTACPPIGEHHSLDTIEAHYHRVLDTLKAPISLYELPQITRNHVAPELLQRLAARYPHLVMLKDTSGADAVATAGLDYGGVFLVRGAESDYASHLKPMGGAYDGLLLSSGNTFTAILSQILTAVEQGRREEALSHSKRLTEVMTRMLSAADGLPFGNMFANGNRAVDHMLAHGEKWRDVSGPYAFTGQAIDRQVMEQIEVVLKDENLLPKKGYMQ